MMAGEAVWRYLSLAKYVDLLSTRALFVPKAALFSDETEGKWIAHALLWGERRRWIRAKENADRLRQLLEVCRGDADEIFREGTLLLERLGAAERTSVLGEVLRDLPRAYRHKREEYLATFVASWTKHHDTYNSRAQEWKTEVGIRRESTYISCWTRAQSMSLAMWSLYGGGIESVAIRSSTERLKSLVERNSRWLQERALCGYVSPVRYADDLQEPTKERIEDLLEHLSSATDVTIAQFSIKPALYDFEQELRILLYPQRRLSDPLIDPHPDANGFLLPIDETVKGRHPFASLVEAVHLHPTLDSQSTMARVVSSLHDRFDCADLPIVINKTEAIGAGMALMPSNSTVGR